MKLPEVSTGCDEPARKKKTLCEEILEVWVLKNTKKQPKPSY